MRHGLVAILISCVVTVTAHAQDADEAQRGAPEASDPLAELEDLESVPDTAEDEDDPSGEMDAEEPSAPADESAPPGRDATPSVVGQPEPVMQGGPEAETTAQIAGLEERVDALSNLHLSGYVQVELRYEDSAEAETYFQIRRGRLKARYEFEMAEFLLQIDATQDGVSLKDAWAAVTLPTPDWVNAQVFAGLFQVPFGFDVQYSSSRRVFPERSQVSRSLFPGERDIGVQLHATFADELLEWQFAVLNGTTVGDPFVSELPEPDGNGFKDLTSRVAVHFGPLSVGLSGLFGEGFRPTQIDDPETPQDESVGAFDFTRYAGGIDARVQYDIDGLGELDVYGEAIVGRNMMRRRASHYPSSADEDLDVFGWYLGAVQSLGEYFALGARYEELRPEGLDDEQRVTLVGMALPTSTTRATSPGWTSTRRSR